MIHKLVKHGITFVWIPPSTTVKGFWLAETPTTQKQWLPGKTLEGAPVENPSRNIGENKPVDSVSYHDAAHFCARIGARLPTEAEWEHACRANSTYGESDIDDIAWYDENSSASTHDVKLKKPNDFGLYDMLGNVWEWTSDLDSSSNSCYVRGGSFFSVASYLRASSRYGYRPFLRDALIGFRCAGDWSPPDHPGPKTVSPESLVECVPIESIFAIGDVFAEGAKPYGLHNWRDAIELSDTDYALYIRKRWRNALRHLGVWISEFMSLSTPTGAQHLAKVAWFCVITLELQRLRSAKADRNIKNNGPTER